MSSYNPRKQGFRDRRDGADPAEACHCAAAIRKRSNANRMADELKNPK